MLTQLASAGLALEDVVRLHAAAEKLQHLENSGKATFETGALWENGP